MKKLLLAVSLVLPMFSLVTKADAQINERKVERDASGKYKLKRRGGVAIFKESGGTTRVTPPTIRADIRVPIKDGGLSTRTKTSDYPGNGKANFKGKEKQSKVKRGGKQINFKAVGISNEDDGFGQYRGSVTGTFTEKGSGWKANLKKEGVQNRGGGDSKVARGMKITGSD